MKKILILSIVVSFISTIFIHFYAFNRTAIYIDPIYHLYDMKQYYETKTIPVVGNRLMNPQYVTDNTTYARIPGGFYYILYLLCYTLGGASIVGARIIYIILCALILILFLFWIYKRFSLYICAILSALILTNGYVIFASNDFWNLISLAGFIYAIIFLIKSKKTKLENIIEKEIFIFYLLFIPATCFTFFIFKSAPGTFRYLYGIFAFSFITIIILFNELLKNKNKLLLIYVILLTLNSINMAFLHMPRYYNLFEAPYTEKAFRNILTAISKDACGKPFKIIPYDDNYFDNMQLSYFPNLDWNRDDNSQLTYFIYYEVENIRLKTTGKSKPYDDILNNLPNGAKLIAGDDKLKVYRYIEK